jgi:hypothetical protein
VDGQGVGELQRAAAVREVALVVAEGEVRPVGESDVKPAFVGDLRNDADLAICKSDVLLRLLTVPTVPSLVPDLDNLVPVNKLLVAKAL